MCGALLWRSRVRREGGSAAERILGLLEGEGEEREW